MVKVLVAEDNLTLLEEIAFALEFSGHEVIRAEDGQAALNTLANASHLPDMIVADIAMPKIDGFELLERIRKEPSWKNMPFMFLTAFDSANSITLGRQLGADDYIVKPFRAEELVEAVESKFRQIVVR